MRTCWVVTDGRAGIENQALGLAEALARRTPLRIVTKRIVIRPPWRRLPRALWGDPFSRLSASGALLRPPFPDIWIGCGRLSVPLTMAVKKRNPATFAVQLQNPRAPLAGFDLVIPPAHDRLVGENVFPIIGSPHRATPEKIGADAATLAPALAHLPQPRVAALIGGANSAYRFGARRRKQIAEALRKLAEGGAGLMITLSRRSHPEMAALLRAALADRTCFLWDGRPVAGLDNPYFGLLGLADHILVTADSVNMTAEAAITGRPIHVIGLDAAPFGSGSAKFERFREALRARGALRAFDGALPEGRYEPLAETERAAAEILRRLFDTAPDGAVTR